MFELEEIVSYRVYNRVFSDKDEALKYSMTLEYRQNLLDRTHFKILKIRDWSMEILVDDCHRILILDGEYSGETRAIYKKVDKHGRYELIELDVDNLPILYCRHGVTYKSLIPELKNRMLLSQVEKLIEEINEVQQWVHYIR